MPDDSSTAGFSAMLPVDPESVVRGLRNALRLLNEELKDINKRAAESLKNAKDVDQALISKASALVAARGELQGSLAAAQKTFSERRATQAKAKESLDWTNAIAENDRVDFQGVVNRVLQFKQDQAIFTKQRNENIHAENSLDRKLRSYFRQKDIAESRMWDQARRMNVRITEQRSRKEAAWGRMLDRAYADDEEYEDSRSGAFRRILRFASSRLDIPGLGLIGRAGSMGREMSEFGRVLSRAGFKGAGAALSSAGGSLLGLATRALPIAGAAAIPAALLGYGLRAYSAQTESIETQGKLASMQAETLSALTGNISSRVLQDSSPMQALRAQGRMAYARDRGMSLGPVGLFSYVFNPFGQIRGSQAETVEGMMQHEAMIEKYRQKYGAQYDPYANQQTHNAAKLSLSRAIDITKNPLGALRYRLATTYYALTGEGTAYMADVRRQHYQAAAELEMKSEDARWASREWYWQNSPTNAVNRVIENEKRRWLRAVELDRIQRYNAWSMT